MQTFNIDISRKNGPLVLYAKQGDSLSRFFKIVFLQDGSPWEPPAGALFSVRFGAPGMPDGWYDTIKEPDGSTHSAFSLKDNALTVELAYEAVSKAGTNTLAVLVLDSGGYQLGMWNLSLQVELTPGENSPEADVYYSLLSEQVAQVLQAKDDAQASAILSQSWAVGGTSSRAGEDTNNSKYWAQQAQQSAQESLGFRTFFGAVRPDLNGDLDPSSPMFAGTGTSITVRSAANRIENVTSHGFTEQSGSGDASPVNVRPIKVGGLKLVEKVLTGDESYRKYANGIAIQIAGGLKNPKAFCTDFKQNALGTQKQGGFWYGYSDEFVYCFVNPEGTTTTDEQVQNLKTEAKARYDSGDPITFWYTPTDESQATGIYTPQISEGESYHCNCIELQQHLCNGDTVDSNVPSGCDKAITLDGGVSDGLTYTNGGDGGANKRMRHLQISLPDMVNYSSGGVAFSERLPLIADWNSVIDCLYPRKGFLMVIIEADSYEAAKAILTDNPLTVYYRSTEYTAKNDEKACMERHVKYLYTFNGTENWVGRSDSNVIELSLTPIYPVDYAGFNSSHCKRNDSIQAGGAYFYNKKFNVNPTGGQFGNILSGWTPETRVQLWKEYLAQQSKAGTPFQLELRPTTPITYAQPAVDLPADPITTETQATLEEPTADTPTLLAVQGETGTYTVSGEKNISLYIKSLIKDGDAATLGGKPPEYFLPADQPAVSAPKSSKPTFAINYGRIVSPDNSGIYIRNADSEGSGVFIGVREGFQTLSPDMNTSGTPVNLGGPSYRWRTLYLQNQPDVSSDGNLKEKVAPLSEKQMLFFDSLNPVQYKLKGDSHDRLHYGFIAQEVEQAMAAAGISDMEFGGFCKDRKIRVVQQYSESGKLLSETVEQLDGYEYSLRYGEFIALNTAAIQAMKKEISELKAEINKLKGV